MSLAALANHMASKGRNGDSMLVHMSKDEVRALQALAERHGKTLTINPETGQPEAFSLKSLLPMIAGMALGPAGFGLMSAGMAGLTVGGVTALATGDISRGLMAGLGAYGGAGLGEALMGASGATGAAGALGVEGAATGAGSQAAMLAEQNAGFGAEGLTKLADSAKVAAGAAPTTSGALGAGLESITKSPDALGNFAKSNWKTLAAAATPVLADAMVPTATKLPTTAQTPSYIRPYVFDPYTQGLQALKPIDASKVRMKDENLADGGIVALADGGISDQQVQDWFAANPNATFADALAAGASVGASASDVANAWSQFAPAGLTGPTTQDIQGAFSAGDYGTAQQLGNLAGWDAQDYVSNLGLNRAQAQDVAKAVGYTGDLSGLDFSSQISPLAYGFYGGVTGTGSSDIAGRVSAADLAQWVKDTGYTGSDLQAAFAANPDLSKAGVTPELLSKLGLTPTLSQASLWQMEHGGSFSAVDQSIDNWIKNNADLIAKDPAAARAKGAADAAASGVNAFDVYMATGKTLDQIFGEKIKQTPVTTTPGGGAGGGGGGGTGGGGGGGGDWTATTPETYAPPGTRNPYGNGITPGDLTYNPDGSITVTPNIPGRPYGGFTGMNQVRNAYTAGGGSLGQSNLFVPRTVADMYARYGNTGGSEQAYAYLMGKGATSVTNPVTSGRPLMLPYGQAMGLTNRSYVQPKQAVTVAQTPAEIAAAKAAGTYPYLIGGDSGSSAAASAAGATGDGSGGVGGGNAGSAGSAADGTGDGGPGGVGGWAYGGPVHRMALGGLGALAGGGQAGYNLGGYSDGGRLLRGPGDGVSDSIPATIGDKQPARLADGEFVVPARIVSELGNGSTEAGARKLYAMMDRVQKARGKTTGKGKVANDTRADKYLPA